jgi:signal transduction histidine kinase
MFAAVFAVAALVSVKAVYAEMSDMDAAFQVPRALPIVISMLALTVPLAWRRRYPLGAAIAVVTAFLVARIGLHVPEESVTMLVVFVAFYSAAVHGRRPLGSYVLLACELAVVLQVARELFLVGYMAGMHPLSQSFELAFNAVVFLSPWVLGAAVRSSRSRETQLADRARELMRERERTAEQAVFAERVRIARELHDVVAHHVSVMGIQAGAARRVMARQPTEAAQALSSIEGSSRTAVLEMQRLLGFLRSDGDSEGFGAQPGLDRVGDLVAESQRSDLDITLTIQGEPRPLPPTLDVSAYRIVQEALTNSRKHSTGRCASVRVRYSSSTLDLEITDDGANTPSDAGPDRHGLIGMRERAALHGGRVDAGPLVGGGFGVHATFPLAANVS